MSGLPGSVAQLVERTTENREVTGSTPVGATPKPPRNRGLLSCTRAGILAFLNIVQYVDNGLTKFWKVLACPMTGETRT